MKIEVVDTSTHQLYTVDAEPVDLDDPRQFVICKMHSPVSSWWAVYHQPSGLLVGWAISKHRAIPDAKKQLLNTTAKAFDAMAKKASELRAPGHAGIVYLSYMAGKGDPV